LAFFLVTKSVAVSRFVPLAYTACWMWEDEKHSRSAGRWNGITVLEVLEREVVKTGYVIRNTAEHWQITWHNITCLSGMPHTATPNPS
jgi:hypothetical protein